MSLPLRPTDYASGLRLPASDLPSLDGTNLWTGTNFMGILDVKRLTVRQRFLYLGPSAQFSAVGGLPGRIGTPGPQGFILYTNSIDRLQLLSGGAIVFASAAPPSAFDNTLFTDNFNRADISPADGWTTITGFGGLKVSSNRMESPSGAGNFNAATPNGVASGNTYSVVADYALDNTSVTAENAGLLAYVSGSSAWAMVAQATNSTASLNWWYLHGAAASAFAVLSAFPAASAGTMRLDVTSQPSGTSAFFQVSASWNATRISAFSRMVLAQSAGNPGLMFNLNFLSQPNWFDNFQVLQSVSSTPLSAEDLAFQSSARFYTFSSPTSIHRWADLYDGLTQFGDQADILVSGLGARFFQVAPGTSAIFGSTVFMPSGTSAALSIAFQSTQGLGLFETGGNSLGLYASGAQLNIQDSTVSSNPSLKFTDKDNTRLFLFEAVQSAAPRYPIARLTAGAGFGFGFGVNNANPTFFFTSAGLFQTSAFASANLPAASSTNDGMVVVCYDTSSLVYYVGGLRFRAASGTSF